MGLALSLQVEATDVDVDGSDESDNPVGSLVEVKDLAQAQRYLNSVQLISSTTTTPPDPYSLLPSTETERAMQHILAELCPSLTNSVTLQEKTMRLLLSIGLDVLFVNSDYMHHIGRIDQYRLAEKPLSADESGEVFGSFLIPPLPTVVDQG
jgi:hypothetical protein